MIGGTLAAGSANAINCYLDRDIDLLMTRTRRRPLPAHQVEPERAVVFGLALGVISFVVMAWFVNLLAAFLTLLAIAFYVVVYTMLLKRSTPQNIVIGGAAGALPPVIGWAAVTGNVGAARRCSCSRSSSTGRRRTSGRCRCGSARTTPRPACRCCPSSRASPRRPARSACTRSSWSRSRSSCSPSARMGLIYLVAAVVLGAIFLWQAYGLWRRGASEEARRPARSGSTSTRSRYLSLLFLAVAIDALVLIPL